MFERVWRMMVKEFLQALRNPRMAGVIFIAPMIQLIVFGYVATTDVRNVTLAVRDLDNTPDSRELVDRFARSGHFTIVARPADDTAARRLLDRGDVQLVLAVNAGFGGDLRGGRTARVQLLVDGTDSNTAAIVLGYAARITGDYSGSLLAERLARVGGAWRPPQGVELRTRAWFNENLESRNYFVPGVIATITLLVTLLLTSMAVVREKELGTMEQIMVTPITPAEFIAGKTLPFAIIGVADAVMIMLVGTLWFGVPLRGSVLLLLGCLLIYLVVALGIGLLISTVCETQQQAMMSTFFFFFPAILLSGFMFPIANMPEPVQWLTCLDPLRYFLVIIRGVFLKAAGIGALWPQVAALAVMAVVVFGLAVSRVRKTMA
ncbi:MAG TPA: ABC transporter permease [Planctomycetota bacterium]|nr:ABC transporter permease [Planctomycetota bacterium]